MRQKQNQLTMIAPLRDGARADLVALLESHIGYQDRNAPGHAKIENIAGLHFLSMFVFEAPNKKHYLVVEASFDGDADAFLGAISGGFAELDEILGFCAGFDPIRKVEFIKAHARQPDLFYVSCPGITREQVQRESAFVHGLRAQADLMVNAPDAIDSEKIIKRLKGAGGEALDKPPPDVPFRVRFRDVMAAFVVVALIAAGLVLPIWLCGLSWEQFFWLTLFIVSLAGAVLSAARLFDSTRALPLNQKSTLAIFLLCVALVALTPWQLEPHTWWVLFVAFVILMLFVALIALFLYLIERKERKDMPDVGRVDVEHMRVVSLNENTAHCIQNHFVNLSTVKPGPIRKWTLRLTLWTIHWLGVYWFNHGKLGRIPSIHFARWIFLDGKEFGASQLLFMTNYDGGWDSYLGDFVDGASEGVSAIWSNTTGFPRTWWLTLGGGSRFEKAFKAYARSGQKKSCAWYSAYPDVSVPQKLSNAKVRRLFDQDATDFKIQDDLLRRI